MKKLNLKTFWGIFIISVCVIVLFLIYFYPLQRILAEKKLAKYMALQGVDVTEIEDIEYHKDYKQDGYYIFVKFYDNEYQYVYRYYLFSTGQGHRTRYNTMYCNVYNSKNHRLDESVEDIKYKPLEWDVPNNNTFPN